MGKVIYSSTFEKINLEIPNEEFILQHNKRGLRCISWHPHYIMTEWTKSKKQAIFDGHKAVISFYENNKLDNYP